MRKFDPSSPVTAEVKRIWIYKISLLARRKETIRKTETYRWIDNFKVGLLDRIECCGLDWYDPG
jgi:hypothetical protein